MILSSFGAFGKTWRYIQYFIVMVIFLSLIILITHPYAVKDNRLFNAFKDELRQDSGSIKLNLEHKDTEFSAKHISEKLKAVKDNRLFNKEPSPDSGSINLNVENKDTLFSAQHTRKKSEIPVLHQYSM